MDDNSEDDGPIIFKRGNNSSKKNQTNPEIKKSPIQKHDGIPAKQVTQKVKTVSSANNASLVPGKKHSTSSTNAPPVTNPKTSTSSANSQAVMANSKTSTSSANHPSAAMTNSKTPTSSVNPSAAMTNSKISSSSANTSVAMTNSKILSSSANTSAAMTNSKTSTSSANASAAMTNSKTSTTSANVSPMMTNSKPSTAQMNQTTVKEEKPSLKSSDCHSEDSEDDKPLSSRVPLSKGNSNLANRRPSSIASPVGSTPLPKPKVNKYEDDSDDEIPLSTKFPMKSNAAASTSKSYDSDENKPLAAKLQQNGQLKNSSNLSNKRPLGEVKISGQSSVKKTKLTHSSTQNDSKPVAAKPESKSDDDDDVPIAQRLKMQPASGNKLSSSKLKVNKVASTSFKKTSKNFKKVVKKSKYVKSSKVSPGSGEGQKWTTLVHSGVIFPPPYKPHGVKMLYKMQPVDLTPEQEEVATMFAVMIDTEYMTKPKFKENFMNDWRKILGKKHVIQNLEECDFTPIYEWHQREKEKKKQMTTEEKKAIKEEKMKQEEVYMWAVVDGVKEKVGNFRVEPPGLFRGRGEHPKMGKLKRRIRPSDIVINIGKDAPIPECPIAGESWKEIRHDNTVTWLAFWNDPINPKEFKYVFLAASSSLKGQSDKVKYEKARMLKDYIQGIRASYTKDFACKDVTKRQIAVATYLIDKLALRAGNEKDDDEADTVGCCTLKVENVEPLPPNILKFDFLGKDSIRYLNEVEVELPVYKAIQQFRSGKKDADDLFDKLDTSKLNAHLKGLMPGLTAKVFRTYNASITLDDMLNKETKGGDLPEKVKVYNHANKEVAIICNHQRTVSKSHSAQMLKLNEKIDELKGVLEELKVDLRLAKKGKPLLKGADGKPKKNINPEALERKIAQTTQKIEKMEHDKETKEDLKTVALGTSKINYLDPRITVAWCKRHEVPIDKMFNKSLLAKFSWAMDVDPSFRF